MAAMIRVVAVDDHPLFLKGIGAMLSEDSGMEFVGTARDVASATDVVRHEAPDVLLLDVQLADGETGLDILRQLPRLSPATRALVLTAKSDDETVVGAIKGGADGYLLKTASPENVRSAISRIAAGYSYLDPAVSDAVRRGVIKGEPPSLSEAKLSPRELEVLRLAAVGMTNAAMGKLLGITTETVKTHLSRAYLRLGANDRAHAVAIAIKTGVI